MQGFEFRLWEGGEVTQPGTLFSEPGPDVQVLFQEFCDQDRFTPEDSLSNALTDILQ